MQCSVCGSSISVRKYGGVAYCERCAFWYDSKDNKMVLQSVDLIRILKADKVNETFNKKLKIKKTFKLSLASFKDDDNGNKNKHKADTDKAND